MNLTNKPRLRIMLVIFTAWLTALAFSMNLSPGMLGLPPMSMLRENPPDLGIWDSLANLVELLGQAIQFNQPVLLGLMVGLGWVYHRTLFRSPRLNVASYIAAAFLTVAALISDAVQQLDAVSALWSSRIQLCKAVLYLAGMMPVYIAGFRVLNRALRWLREAEPLRLRHPFFTPLWVMALCWLPTIIARYPGAIIQDTFTQMLEFSGQLTYSNLNPAVHTALVGGLMNIGYALGKPSIGLALNMLWQVVAMLCVLAWMLSVMQECQFSRRLVIGLWVLFALSPLYSAYATTVTKDVACAIFTLLFAFLTALLVLQPAYFWRHGKRHLLLLVLSAALSILMRKNGMGIVLPTGLAAGLYALIRQKKAAPLLCSALAVALALGVNAAVISRYQVSGGSIREVLSIPFQQTARTLREHGDTIPQEERDAINAVLNADYIEQEYLSYLSDPVKNTFRSDATTADLLNYGKVWLRQFVRYPSTYLDAFACMTHRIFSPTCSDVDFHSIYFTRPLFEKDGVTYDLTDGNGVFPLEGPKELFTQWYALIGRLPVVGLAVNLGFFTCLSLMLACLTWRKSSAAWLCWLPCLMTIAMLLLAPITSTRYALPLFYTLPILLMASVVQKRS